MKTKIEPKHIKETIRKYCGGHEGLDAAAKHVHSMMVADLKSEEPLNESELNNIIKMLPLNESDLNNIIKMLTEEKEDIIKRAIQKEEELRVEWFESENKLRTAIEACSGQVQTYEDSNKIFKETCERLTDANVELQNKNSELLHSMSDLSEEFESEKQDNYKLVNDTNNLSKAYSQFEEVLQRIANNTDDAFDLQLFAKEELTKNPVILTYTKDK